MAIQDADSKHRQSTASYNEWAREATTFPAVAASTVAWAATLSSVQSVGRTLGVSCANGLFAITVGGLGVGFASVVCAQTGRLVSQQQPWSLKSCHRILAHPLKGLTLERAAKDAVVGTALFLLLGGNVARLLPSDLRRPGACRGFSLPAERTSYASAAQRTLLRTKAFEVTGCHSCGSKRGSMVADHQPPNRIVDDARKARGLRRVWLALTPHTLTQQFYPHCLECSGLQAAAMRGAVARVLVQHSWLSQRPQLLLVVGAMLGYYNA